MDQQLYEQTYRLIQQLAGPFTEQVRAAARASHNEAEFRTHFTRHIEDVAARLGVELTLREEYTLVTGRADAVYNRVVIEYEPPGSLRPNLSHRHTQHAVNQTKGYIEGIARREKFGKDRLLGVALDGGYYVFVRYREGHWYPEPPLEVTTTSTARFLRALFSLASGRALIPENLVEDFSGQSAYSQQVTRSLYQALEGHTDDLVGMLFAQWRLFFSEVSGYDEATARLRDKKELRQFAKGMGLRPETTDPPRLFFAIHTYFSFLVKAIATEGAKREVESVTVEIEPDLLYPLLRGRDVSRWRAEPLARLLLVQDPIKRRGIDEDEIQRRWPKTWAYLKRFETVLRKRSGFKRYFTRTDKDGRVVETAPFYSMFDVGEYTLAPYKVVWREQSAWFTCTVVQSINDRPVIPDHKLMLVDLPTDAEAHYLCGALNSAPTTLAVWAYVISIQQTTHILSNICVPKYDATNPTHQQLAELSQRAHELAAAGDKKVLKAVEDEVDRAAAELWGLTGEELAEIRRSLEELRG
jgi:hypothetical protein